MTLPAPALPAPTGSAVPSAAAGTNPPAAPQAAPASSSSPIVHAAALTKTFGDHTAVDGIDLDLPAGSILGLIGPSGCGKTTLIRMLIGITEPTSGELAVMGKQPSHFTARDRVSFGYMPQIPVLFPNLTVWSNLNFVASMYGVPLRHRRRDLRALLKFVDLDDHRGKLLSECSGGMQRRLTLAATLVHQPDLIFLDEPTAGIDPILRERFWTQFRQLRDDGRTLVVSTQYVGEAVSCDRVAVMSDGRLLTVQEPGGLARFAFDGDLVTVRFGRGWVSAAEMSRLSDLPFVRSVRRCDDGVTVAVADAATDLERLREAACRIQLPVDDIELVDPTYDEVFVAIVERDRAQRAATEEAGAA